MLDGVGCLALLAVLAFFVRVRDYDPWMYRGGFLLVALCTAVLVAVVVHPASVLGRALGTRTLRWIGVRSYGIYLWHWPVMMLTRPGIDVPWRGTGVILAQIALTLVLAALSYRYVETPVRSGAAQRRLRAWLDAHTPQERLRWSGRLARRRRARARPDARPARARLGGRLGADRDPGGARARRRASRTRCGAKVGTPRARARATPAARRCPRARSPARTATATRMLAPPPARCRPGRSSRSATR